MKPLVYALAALVAAAAAGAQTRVIVTDVGPGSSGRVLQAILRRPHVLVEPDTGWFVLGRGLSERSSLVVLGRTAAVAGKVDGDVIVVGGDLFVRPGAEISGRAIAIGGGTYASTLAFVGGGTESYRDNTFEIRRTPDGYHLAYRSLREDASPPLLFPLLYGFRVPTYDRVNGLSLPFGPALTLAQGRLEANVLVTYRSDIGVVDPHVQGALLLGRRSRVTFDAGRGTFSREDWIWQDYVNSLSALAFGIDTRNYYRADRGRVTLHRLWEFTTARIEPFVGALIERSWPVGPVFGARSGPWSISGRTDSLGMWRPNPQVPRSTDVYGQAGAVFAWEPPDLRLSASTLLETSIGSVRASNGAAITSHQVTSDLAIKFPTFGEQDYAIDVHWVATVGDTPEPQRFAYLGGSGTLPFLDLLEQGGDQLLLIDQRYSVPLLGIQMGLLGSPTLQLRHRIGSAGVGKLPAFEQMIGVGVSVTVIRGEIQLEPTTRKVRFSTGFTFSR